MFNRWLSKGCRQFGLISDFSDMVSGQRSEISINPHLVETLSTLINMTALMSYVLKFMFIELVEGILKV